MASLTKEERQAALEALKPKPSEQEQKSENLKFNEKEVIGTMEYFKVPENVYTKHAQKACFLCCPRCKGDLAYVAGIDSSRKIIEVEGPNINILHERSKGIIAFLCVCPAPCCDGKADTEYYLYSNRAMRFVVSIDNIHKVIGRWDCM